MSLSTIYNFFEKYPVVVTDTRKVVPDSIFFALKGENFNGNEFAELALQKGCVYAIVDEKKYVKNDSYILVDDVLSCLQDLSREHRRRLALPILAITGTNGKTTTKELTFEVLKKKFTTYATQGNLNNHIGVPLTLLSMTKETEFGIVEMGANHPDEIAFLCDIAEPNYGIITNVGKAHLEGFGSFEGVKKTKKELYDYLQAKGKVFVNSDNEHLMTMLNDQDVCTYGNSESADSKARFLQADPYLVLELRSAQIGKLYIKTKLIGAYNFENALAAVTIGRFFDINETDIKDALELYEPKNNRSQLKKTKNNILFLDAYNANPSSMNVAINNFANLKSKNKLVILGDMLELGDDSDKEHRILLELLEENALDKVCLVGKNFTKVNTNSKFETFPETKTLVEKLELEEIKNYYILIKGSRGIKLEQIVEKL
ncbi:UDP-N-acetylmuramoyl-tripeptide--D-alanyl-D-alanine ligase [Marinifilum sp. RC60d5]|uniref:UDP-N-acetylmuramoyl-tripeptide--D-alanyl-D- alanine ligase n=1 Tax=Marinifilum sp. RC60d5 TaxID=3458414 RepID=UPI004036E0A3